MTEHFKRIYLRSLLWTMLGAVAVFSVADLAPSFFVIGVVGASIGYWYASQGPSNISRIAINALLAVVVVLGLTNALRGSFSVSSFALFSLLLMILKLFDLRTPRDHGQIIVLSLALVIAAALTSGSLPTGIMVLFMGFVLIRTLMLFRIFALSSRSQHINSIESSAKTDLRSTLTATGFVCSIVALLIFLIMPRSLGTSALGQWGGAGGESITTGFADDVELGRPGRITTSPKPVLHLSISDRNQQPVGSVNSRAIYLRGSVLTQYSEGRWVSHQEQSVPTTFRTRVVDQYESIPIVPDNTRAEWTLEYQISFDNKDQNYGYLFTPWKPLELKSNTKQARIGVDPETRMILLASQPVPSYRVRTSDPEFEPIVFAEDRVRQSIDTDEIDPKIATFAAQILARAGIDPNPETRPFADDLRAVRAIENHLRTQFKYTLVSEPVPQDRDATEWFLFDRKEGHCEYYASALTLMSRSVGVPARVVTGFVAAEYNDVTGRFTVRESNAHAWVEAMVAPGTWRTFDGTPQDEFHAIHEPEPSLTRTVVKFYEAIEHAWGTLVISYDSNDRDRIFGSIDKNLGFQSIGETLESRIAAGRLRLIRRAFVVAGSVFVFTTLLGLTMLFFGKTAWFKQLKTRIRLVVHSILGSLGNHQSQSDRARMHLLETIDEHLVRIDAPRIKGVPLKIHLHTISDSSSELLNEAADLLYAQSFDPGATLGATRFQQEALELISNLQAIR